MKNKTPKKRKSTDQRKNLIPGITSLHDFPGSIVRFSSPGNSRQGSSIVTNHDLPIQSGWQSISMEISCIHVNGPLLPI